MNDPERTLAGSGEGGAGRDALSARGGPPVRKRPRTGAESRSMRRILVIEDEADIALSLKYNLEREGGFSVQTAADGRDGRSRL